MTVVLDATALLAAHVAVSGTAVVRAALDTDDVWCAAATALGEAMVAIDALVDDDVRRNELEDEIRRTWDWCHIVPIDDRCLERAAEIAREQPVSFARAVHLAAADRLPRPVRFVTFDAAQIPVALSLGFDVIST
jgi:uncharacterized protein